MKSCASPTYRKLRRERCLRASRAGVAARERQRLRAMADQPAGWPLVRAVWLAVYAAPDGRHIELHAVSERGHWVRVGSERACVAAVGRVVWGMRAVKLARKGT